jgi:sirohydrochlorin ferrochelatase
VTTGYVVFAHGSRLEAANNAVRRVAEELADAAGCDAVEAAFLDLDHPTLAEAVDLLVSRGARRVAVIPYFLTPGRHLTQDMSALVEEIRARNEGVELVVTNSLDAHPALLKAVLDLARQAFPAAELSEGKTL